MSIDAIISQVTRTPDGDAVLHLMPREEQDRHHGERRMILLDPPANIEAAVGTEVWGGSEELMVGDRKWAIRIGYTRCRLVRRKGA